MPYVIYPRCINRWVVYQVIVVCQRNYRHNSAEAEAKTLPNALDALLVARTIHVCFIWELGVYRY